MTDAPLSPMENASSVIEIMHKIRILSRELMKLPPVSEETLTSVGTPKELAGVLLNHRRNITSVELTTQNEIKQNVDLLQVLEAAFVKLLIGMDSDE